MRSLKHVSPPVVLCIVASFVLVANCLATPARATRSGTHRSPASRVPQAQSTCSASPWRVVSSPNPGQSGDVLSGITALSANDAWAVGYTSDGYTLVEHYTWPRLGILCGP